MLSITKHTYPFILIRGLVFIVSGGTLILSTLLIWSLGQVLMSGNELLQFISQLAYIFVGIGVGVTVHHYVFRPILHIISLAHCIAATVVLLGLPYEGSLTKYAFSQMSKNFLQLATNSAISIGAIKGLKGLKEAILQKDIIPSFNLPTPNKLAELGIKLVTYNISLSLKMVDEILVSYTWFTTDLFDKFYEADDVEDNTSMENENPTAKKRKRKKMTVRTRLKNQAKFLLEGVVLYLRVFPKMLIWNFGYIVLIEIAEAIITFFIYWAIWTLVGLSFWTIPLFFLTWRTVDGILHECISYSFMLNASLYTFYSELKHLKNVTSDEIFALVTKIPSLGAIAKKTGLAQFKDLQVSADENSEENAGGLVNMEEMKEAMKQSLNKTCKVFMVDECDVLKTTLSPTAGESIAEMNSETEVIDDEMPATESVKEDTPMDKAEEVINIDDSHDTFVSEEPAEEYNPFLEESGVTESIEPVPTKKEDGVINRIKAMDRLF